MSSNVAASMEKLKIDDKIKSRAEPAESWEDAAEDSADESKDDIQRTSTPVRPATATLPAPPPPTPSSPTDARRLDLQYQKFGPLSYESASAESSRVSDTPERRPEKTTAVASRLIAAGLGQRAPRRTPEQREYDQAMKIQEKKKRDQAKADEERKIREREAAKKAMWDD